MSIHRILHVLFFLLLTPFLTLGQKVPDSDLPTPAIDLSGRAFVMVEQGDSSKTENNLNLYLLFHKDGKAVFRATKGTTVIKDNPLSWRFVRDLLYIQNSPIELIAEGKTQTIDREPVKLTIEKTSNGYLLKETDSNTFWSEIK